MTSSGIEMSARRRRRQVLARRALTAFDARGGKLSRVALALGIVLVLLSASTLVIVATQLL